jgi:hypothetical protein
MKLKMLFAILVLAVVAIPSSASPTAGSQLKACQSTDGVMQGLCIGYMQGLYDATSGLRIAMDDGGVVKIVYADNVTTEQIIHVYVKYVTDNPEVENKAAAYVYVDAMVKAKLMGFQTLTQKAETH